MRKLILTLLTILLSACTLTTFDKAKQSFMPLSDQNQYGVSDKWVAFDSIDEPFYGDCEDFAFTLQKQIGGVVWKVYIDSPYPWHAVLVKDGWVYDNLKINPIRIEQYSGIFIEKMEM